MTRYFIAPSGSDSNNGLSKTAPFATANKFESLPPAPDDELRWFPGTYRMTGTSGASGTSGHPVSHVGDEDGQLTDGVGGEVRITGSDDDLTIARANVLSITHNWRTFKGLHLDSCSGAIISLTGNNIIFDRCAMFGSTGGNCLTASGASCNNVSILRCEIGLSASNGIVFSHSATVNDTNHLVQNCNIWGLGGAPGISITRIGGINIRNCLLIGNNIGVRCGTSPAVGQVNNINNCIITGCSVGLSATATSDLTADYNNIFGNVTSRVNVNVGAHDQSYPVLLSMPLLTLGVHSRIFGALSPNSQLGAIAGINVPSDDMFGTARLATSSWAAIQYILNQRFNDAGEPRGRRG